MRAIITHADGWKVTISSKKYHLKTGTVVNGTLAREALFAGVAERVPNSQPPSPPSEWSRIRPQKKAPAVKAEAPPENKGSDE